jgi:hypothetical protein
MIRNYEKVTSVRGEGERGGDPYVWPVTPWETQSRLRLRRDSLWMIARIVSICRIRDCSAESLLPCALWNYIYTTVQSGEHYTLQSWMSAASLTVRYPVSFCNGCWSPGSLCFGMTAGRRTSIQDKKSFPVWKFLKKNSVALVRKRTIPTERPPLSAK